MLDLWQHRAYVGNMSVLFNQTEIDKSQDVL